MSGDLRACVVRLSGLLDAEQRKRALEEKVAAAEAQAAHFRGARERVEQAARAAEELLTPLQARAKRWRESEEQRREEQEAARKEKLDYWRHAGEEAERKRIDEERTMVKVTVPGLDAAHELFVKEFALRDKYVTSKSVLRFAHKPFVLPAQPAAEREPEVAQVLRSLEELSGRKLKPAGKRFTRAATVGYKGPHTVGDLPVCKLCGGTFLETYYFLMNFVIHDEKYHAVCGWFMSMSE